jgi:hypothetical protein
VSDVSGATPADAPRGLWARYRSSALWVRIVIPLAIVIVLAGVIVLIVNSGNESSTSDQQKHAIFLALAKRLQQEEATTTTTSTSTTTASTTTTVATTTTAAATTAPPSLTTTLPPTTQATTTEATTEAPPTEAPATEAPTEAPETSAPVTESAPPTTDLALPPGQVAASPEDFRTAWNTAAAGTNVPTIDTPFVPQPFAGDLASVADLGGNIRLALLSATNDGPVAEAVLVWLPLSGSEDQATQNQAFRDAFNVLMKTVNPNVTAQEQTTVATALGLDSDHPPFETGTTKNTTLPPQDYRLEAIVPSGGTEPDTLIGVTSSLPR